MSVNLEQQLGRSQSDNRGDLHLFKKACAVVILCLLMFGYLGFNLFRLEDSALFAIRSVCTGIVVVAILLESARIRDLPLPLLVTGIVSALGMLTSSISLNLFFLFLFVVATRSVSFEFLVRSAVYITGSTVAMTVILVQLGVFINEEDIVGMAYELFGDEFRVRDNFGFRNPNAFASIVSAFSLLFMLTGKQLSIRALVAVTVSIVFFIYNDSRTMVSTTILFVVLAYGVKYFKAYPLLWYWLGVVALTGILFASAFPAEIVATFPLFDMFISNRSIFITYYYSELSLYAWLIGGAAPSQNVTVDNSFALLLGACGLPFLIYLFWVLQDRLKRCIEASDYRSYAFLLSFSYYSFSESSLVRPEALIGAIFLVLLFNPGFSVTRKSAKDGAR
jgi:hypothetical protein